jgi:hypothetical protein
MITVITSATNCLFGLNMMALPIGRRICLCAKRWTTAQWSSERSAANVTAFTKAGSAPIQR